MLNRAAMRRLTASQRTLLPLCRAYGGSSNKFQYPGMGDFTEKWKPKIKNPSWRKEKEPERWKPTPEPWKSKGLGDPLSRTILTPVDIEWFGTIIGESNCLTDEDTLEPYNKDWMGKYEGCSRLVLRPGSTEEVSKILSHCHRQQLHIVPQGGNTGLVGGSVPYGDEIILSLSRMNKVVSLDEYSGSLICEAGCVLESLQQHVSEKGFTMPLDLGAKGSCQIGGNLATNAGGLRYLRYGSLHGTVLGLEAVLADGTILDNLTSLRKDNTGYDLKQLFIGSEGTLGVITGVSLQLPRAPQSVKLAFLGVDSYEDVLKTYVQARKQLGEILSAIEFLDAEAHEVVTRDGSTRAPLSEGCKHYLLIETHGSNEAHDEEKLTNFLESVMGDGGDGSGGGGCVIDGTIAQDESQSAGIWKVREGITSALARQGCVYKYDVSLPLDKMYELVEETRERLAPLGATTTAFGHLGDGNLHLNVTTPGKFEVDDDVLNAIEPFVYEWVSERRGSISAEHGIGRMKREVLHLSKSDEMIEWMRMMKLLFDPLELLNPGKVLPYEPTYYDIHYAALDKKEAEKNKAIKKEAERQVKERIQAWENVSDLGVTSLKLVMPKGGMAPEKKDEGKEEKDEEGPDVFGATPDGEKKKG